jgi:hypothetical protein
MPRVKGSGRGHSRPTPHHSNTANYVRYDAPKCNAIVDPEFIQTLLERRKYIYGDNVERYPVRLVVGERCGEPASMSRRDKETGQMKHRCREHLVAREGENT